MDHLLFKQIQTLTITLPLTSINIKHCPEKVQEVLLKETRMKTSTEAKRKTF